MTCTLCRARKSPFPTPSYNNLQSLNNNPTDHSISHALRKSTSFTALDFAPQPRFARSAAGSSDAGSIRSGRSNLSAAQLASIRAGAYRVSRIPKEFVGTKDDFSASLKPSWDMRDHIGRA